MLEDEQIIALFFSRSEQAIRELDAKYGGACFQLSNQILQNRQDAEECVNDAYYAAWNTIPPEHPNPLRTFVLKIVRNLSLKAYRKNAAEKRNSAYTVALEEIEPFLSGTGSPDEEVDARELARRIEAFLDRQSQENRVIFLRRYWFADSCKDIAERVGLSEKNVTVRLTRLRQRLKEDLKEMEVIV